ncbi:hypothetical protein B0H16DRAFT_1682034 [Mycena metata]|uniref:SET domain-containing protein n=1 Tax=Mycena metata TaxID=1033252 RepID=A0AAD7KFU6_9AGAR|nr:hypothetical protein B0H16DRAFT_1682034 [Mycena metata]
MGERVVARPNSKFQFSDVCRHTDDSRIISADYRLSFPAHFLFLPSAENATLVIIDALPSVDVISDFRLWENPIRPPPLEPAFVIREVGDKGMGMFATRPIARGEPIICERPTLVLHDRLSVHKDQHHAFYESALAGLSPDAQTAISTLRNAHPETPELSRIRGIIYTNCLAVYFPHDTSRAFSALCGQLCRANHSCAPNAHYSPVVDTFECKLSAMRAIAEGEEITMAYANVAASTAERRECLLERYKFECHCTACDLPEPQATESDRRRTTIGASLGRINDGGVQESVSIARVKDLIKLAEEEGMVEEAWVLSMAGMRYAQRHNDRAEELGMELQKMNFMRMLEGNDADEFGAFAKRKGLSAEELMKIFEVVGREDGACRSK